MPNPSQPRVRTVYTLTDEYRVIKASYDKDNGSQSRQLRPVQFLGGAGLVADDQVGACQPKPNTPRLQAVD